VPLTVEYSIAKVAFSVCWRAVRVTMVLVISILLFWLFTEG